MLILWIIVFIVSLAVLVKSADEFLENAELIGLAIGMSPFIVGITIVSAGTSLPELASSMFAVIAGASDIVIANVVGSNIANILLIGGSAAVLTKGFAIKKKFLMVDMFLLGTVTAIGIFFIADGVVHVWESAILLAVAVAYFVYTVMFQGKEDINDESIIQKHKVTRRNAVVLVLGMIGLFVGAKYVIESVIALSEILAIPTGLISLIAIAFGTSLPELIVSIQAARKGKATIVMGNILGSNTFNMLFVIGIPGLIGNLAVDSTTLFIGVPAMALATGLLAVFVLDKHLNKFEGGALVLIYVVFILRIVGII